MSQFYRSHRRHIFSTEGPTEKGTQNGGLWLGSIFVLLVGFVLSSPLSAQAQTVTDVRPESGSTGDTVRIHGGLLGGISTVTIGGSTATLLNQTSTLLEVEVPSGISGPAAVEVGTVTAADRFTVLTGGSMAFGPDSTLTATRNGEVTRGDLDGDGDLDLLVTGTDGSGNPVTTLYYNDGTGGFSEASNVSSSLANVSNGTADLADLNGNGRLDILLTGTNSSGNPTTKLYTNDGGSLDDGSLTVTEQASAAPPSGFENSAADLGDLDADGDIDLVVAGDTTGSNARATQLYRNDGSGSFTLASTASGNFVDVENGTVDFGDVNGDDTLDVVVTGVDGGGNPTTTIYEYDSGSYVASGLEPGVTNSAVDLGDVTGNGVPDLVLTGSDGVGPVTEFFSNGGTGSFTSEQVLSPAVENGTADFADVDGDGDLDLLITGNDGDLIPYTTLYEYDDTNTPLFSAASTSGFTAVTNGGAVFADYDGDGRVNFFLTGATDSDSRSATLYQPVLRPTSTSPTPNAPSFPVASDMEFVFNLPVADLTGLADSIVVRGSQNGEIDDDGSLSGGTEQLTYGPTPPFAPGERVSVLFKKGLESTDGLPFFRPASFQFRAAASKGPAIFPLSRSVSSSENGVRSVATGYLTGNGNLDLVVVASGDDEVTLYEGNGDGSFAAGSVLDSGITYARVLTLADLNSDGLLDVVVGTGESESSDPNDIIRYYLNQGGGTFGEGQDITNGGSADDVRDLKAEDLNGDGHVDLVAVTQDNNSVLVYTNNGGGSEEDGSLGFSETLVNNGNADDPRTVHVTHVDRNGTPDLIVGSVSDDNISWYANSGGSFGGEQVIESSNAINPRDLDAADFDGDGLSEVVAAQRGSDSNSGDGAVAVYDPFISSFDQSVSWSQSEVATTDSVLATTTADVNADGLIDIVAGSVGGDSLVWYENTGGGGNLSFGAARVLDTGVHDVQDVIASDVDGDGSLDPIVASIAEDQVSHYPNLAGPSVIGTSPAQNAVGVDTARTQITFTFSKALDPNSVGVNSVSLSGEQSGRISPSSVDLSSSDEELEVGLGSGITLHPGEEVRVSVIADSVLSADGAPLDTTYVLTFTAATAPGSGNFVEAGINPTGVEGGDADWGDYDDDGDLDLIITGDSNGKNTSGGEVLRLYENNGDGTFTEIDVPTDLAADSGVIGMQDGASIEWGDYDQDGNLDLAVSGYNGGSSPFDKTRVYRQRDDGLFETVETESGVFAGASGSSVSWADYDGDGDRDLVVTGPSSDEGETAYLYRYDQETNSFAQANSLVPVNTISGTDWGDVDNDGDLDLVITGLASSGSNTKIYRNDGDSDSDGAIEFAQLEATNVVSGSNVDIVGGSAEFGDVNGDGALDLLLTGEDESTGDPKTRFYLNENSGAISFSVLNTQVRQDSVKEGEATLGDFSGDGQLDLAAIGDSTTLDDPSESTSAIFQNEGGSPPSFSKINASITPVDSASVAWADYNGDGTLDLVVTGDDETDTPTTTIYKQSPALQITSTTPAPNAVGVDTSRGSIFATFNKNIDFTTANDRVAVFGDQSGSIPLSGVQQGAVANELEIILSSTFDPQPGEQVRVSIFADSTTATDGTTLPSTYTFQFTTNAQSVTPSFPVDSVLTDTVDTAKSVEAAKINNTYDAPDALVAVDGSDDKIGWFRNTDGQGDFSGLRDIETGFFSPYDAVPADLDGDGTVGVVGGGASLNTLRGYLNDGGSPPAFTGQTITTDGSGPHDVTAADLDGDGDLDPVAALAGADAVVWYENRVDQGDGFAAADTVARVPHPDAVAVADVNGNGTLDVISASGGTDGTVDNLVAWHANEAGDGSEWTTNTLSTDVSGDNSGHNIGLAVGDLDGDGNVDVLTTSYLDGTVSWFENTAGDGSSWTRSFIAQSVAGPTDVASADLDGDGNLDVLYSLYLDSRVAWFENTDGNGSFSSEDRLITNDTSQPRSVAAADFNGDGQLDVLAAGDSKVAWHPNVTIAPQVVTEPPSDTTTSGFTAEALVNPGGASTDVVFEYGEDIDFGPDSTFVASSSPISGDDTTSVSATVDTLQSGTKYYYRVVATNSVGISTGDIDSVTTIAAAPPQVTADSVRGVTDSSAVVYGAVNPGNDTTQVYLALGRAGANSSSVQPIDTLRTALTSDQVVRQAVDTLRPSTEYQYEFSAVNMIDSTSSELRTFTTANVPPIAVNDTTTIDEDQSVTIPVLSNDSDLGGQLDTSTVAVVDSPSVGIAEADGTTGEITYTPTPDSNGSDRFAYVVADDSSATDTADVIITIEAINDLPLARADTVTVREDSAAVVSVLANDTDVEGPLDTASVAIASGPPNGAASVTAEGEIRYEPDRNYSGPDSLRYTVADTAGARSDQAPVRIDVGAVTLALPDTVEAGAVAVGTRRSLSVTVQNTGETLLTGLSASMEGADSSDYAVQGEPPLGDSLAVGERQSLSLQFEPSATGLREARFVVQAAGGAADTAAVRGLGMVLTVEASPPARGAAANIDLMLEGGIEPILGETAEDASTLYARKGGTRSYRALPLVEVGQDPLQLRAQVPDTLVTTRGIDYFAVVVGEGPAGRQDTLTVPGGGPRRARRAPRHLPVQFEALSPPAETKFQAEAYRMVSVPAVLEQGIKGALEAHYGSYDRGKWRVLQWAPGAGDYQEFPAIDSLDVGEGFWLITAEGTPPRLADGQTPNANQARTLTLEPGWNQIGSPFGYAVPWDTVQAASGLSGEAIDGPIAYRDSAYRPGQSRLMPWEAYFVFNAQSEPDTLVVPPVGAGSAAETVEQSKRLANKGGGRGGTAGRSGGSNRSAAQKKGASGHPSPGQLPVSKGASSPSSSRKSDAASAAPEESPYTLRVKVRPVAEGADGPPAAVTLGLRAAARTGRDRFDRAQAPPIGQALRLGVLQKTGGRSVPHAESFKPSDENGRVWRLRLNNPLKEETTVRLRLAETGTLPAGQERYVLDLKSERRRVPGGRFELEPEATRMLKVIVGTEAYAEQNSGGISVEAFTNELRGNYPNPFNEETTIEYVVSEEQEVSIEVYNLLGQRIRTLVEGTEKAGLHAVKWGGENRYGKPVGSGVYFYRIEAEDFTETRKMVLVK